MESSNLQGELRHAAKAGYAYISAHAPTVHRLCNEAANEIERLRVSAEGAVKWLLSDSAVPAREIHARDLLLIALGITQDAFREKFKDEIISNAVETEGGTK